MRLFLLALLVFALVTSGIFISSHLATKALSEMQKTIAAIPFPTPDDEDLSVQHTQLQEVMKNWDEISTGIGVVVSHQDIMVLEEELAALLQNAKCSNKDLYLESLARVDYILSHMHDTADVLFRNIL